MRPKKYSLELSFAATPAANAAVRNFANKQRLSLSDAARYILDAGINALELKAT